MKNLVRFFTIMVMMTLSLTTFSSCSDDDDDMASSIQVINSSSYTFDAMSIVLRDANQRLLAQKNYGSINNSITNVNCSSKAVKCYFLIRIGSKYAWSYVGYSIKDLPKDPVSKKPIMEITNELLDQWFENQDYYIYDVRTDYIR